MSNASLCPNLLKRINDFCTLRRDRMEGSKQDQSQKGIFSEKEDRDQNEC